MGWPRLLLPLLLAILMAGCAQGEALSEVETRVEEGLGTNISPLKAEIREKRSKTSVKKAKKPKNPKNPKKPKHPKKPKKTLKGKSNSRKASKGKNGKKGKKGRAKRKRKGKKKKKKSKKTKQKNRNRNTKTNQNRSPRQCEATVVVDDDCLINAVDALSFEKNQIQNFFKTEARMKGHKKVSGNKYKKNDKFNVSAYYMLKALGGNLSNPTCGSSEDKAAEEAMKTYKTLSNCSATIMEACEMPSGTHTMNETFYTGCGEMYNKTKKVIQDCMTNATYKDNGPAACSCWKETMEDIEAIKAYKCTTGGKAQSIKMKRQRKKCIDAFTDCKKAEDAAIALINTCMSGDVDTNTGANEASLARAKGL